MKMTDSNSQVQRDTVADVPELPDVTGIGPEETSTLYSHFRSELSRLRTGLSQHRTHLSDNRTEMSMRRTGMSFQRTRMSADRTLMSELRTSLSLIGFGFTIYQAFEKLHQADVIGQSQAPRNFGLTLIVLGVLLLIGGIGRHIQFATELRGIRKLMADDGLVHAETRYPVSLTLIVAIMLVILGIGAATGIVFNLTWLS